LSDISENSEPQIIKFGTALAETTSNLNKAYVTRDSSGPATLAIRVQHVIK